MTPPRMVPDISFGNILIAASMFGSSILVLTAVVFAWANLRSDVDHTIGRLTAIEERMEDMPERLVRIETLLHRIENHGYSEDQMRRPRDDR